MADQWWTRLNEYHMTARTRSGQWVPFNYLECPTCEGYGNESDPCDECNCRGVVAVRDRERPNQNAAGSGLIPFTSVIS